MIDYLLSRYVSLPNLIMLSGVLILFACIINRISKISGKQQFVYTGKQIKPKKVIEKVHEKECRRIVEKYFNASFPTIRPTWLTYKKPMELDMYNEELKLAFEYDGKQHYEYSPFFHSSPDKFTEQQYKDRLKDKLCKEKGVCLIRIPYTIEYQDLEKYIIDKIKKEYKPVVN